MTARCISYVGLLGTVLALAGCGEAGSARRGPSQPPAPPSLIAKVDLVQPGGRLVIAASTSPQTFNPLFSSDAASDSVVRLLFAPLISLDWATQEPRPALAESWTNTADQRTWTLKLRPGVRWSDGEPFSADDVVFTWNALMYNREFNKITGDLFRIGGKQFVVSKLDNLTVRVVTPEVFAPFLEFFGSVVILPKHTLESAVNAKVFPAAYGLTSKPGRIVGCGPYRLKELRRGQYTLLERSPDYWVADRQGHRLPGFDEVMFTVTGLAPESELVAFLGGKSDVCDAARPQYYPQLQQAAAAGKRFQLVELGVGAERDFLWFNQNTGTNSEGKPIVVPAKLKWFRNTKFRQAFSCAIDRDRLVREAYGGRAQPSYGFISTENQRWNNPNIPHYGFDPARARALLAEGGFQIRNADGAMQDADGNAVEIQFYSNLGNPLRERAARMIQEDLSKLGIKMIYLPIDYRALLEKINATYDYECALMGLGGGGCDPASQINVLRSSEELHQWFPFQKTPSTDWEARLDSLMDAQMRTLDFAQRKKCFDEVQVILAEELPMVYTVAPFAVAAMRPDVANLRPAVLSPYHLTWNLEELCLRKK